MAKPKKVVSVPMVSPFLAACLSLQAQSSSYTLSDAELADAEKALAEAYKTFGK